MARERAPHPGPVSDWLLSRVGRRRFDLADLKGLADLEHGGSLGRLLMWLERRARSRRLPYLHRARVDDDIETLLAAGVGSGYFCAEGHEVPENTRHCAVCG